MGVKTYSTAVDMWSVGCIFAELLLKEPLFQAKGEIELLSMIFKLLGPPTKNSWSDYFDLPNAKTITLPSPQPHAFRSKFPHLSTAGLDLLMSFLTYDPEQRISAEEAIQHPYFTSVALLQISFVSLYFAIGNHPYPNILISLDLSHLRPPEKSAFCICWQKYLFLNLFHRRRKAFDSPSAPVRAADYKLLAESEIP